MNIVPFLKDHLKLRIWVLPIAVLCLDQISKFIIHAYLFNDMSAIKLLFFFNLVPVWNSGISFGMFNETGEIGRIFFIILGFTFGVIIPIYTSNWNFIERIGAGFLSGGALGNALDRVIYGSVVDFLDFHWNDIHFPTFNFADTFITFGVILIFFASFIKSN